MDDDAAVVVSHVSKNFKLPNERAGSLKALFTSLSRGRTKGFTRQHALHDVSFEIKKGEFFGIVGRNGSGKSTLLKMIAGIYQPTSGKIQVAGRLVPFIELGVGFNPELTGRQNVFLNGALLGFSEKEIEAQYDEIVGFAELEKFMDQKLKNYSSGMQVRLAFSMAVRAKAEVLLIDEVLAVGDAEFQRKCFDYFNKLKGDGTTVIFVSHSMNAIREFCTRGVLIEKSEIVFAGKSAELANKYEQLFLEKPVDKEVDLEKSNRWGDGTVRIRDVKLNSQTLTQADKDVILSVKLEAIRDNEHLMTGYAIKNTSGQFINGTNTWTISKELPKIAPGESCVATWKFPNIYEDGLYTVDVYTYGKDNVPYDVLDDVLSFRVKLPNKSGFMVRSQQTITINKVQP